MSTEIYTDSRFTGLETYFTSPNISTHVIKGGGVKQIKQLLRREQPSSPKLYVICVGINDIPEGIYDLSDRRQEEIYSDLVWSFKKINEYIQRLNRANRAIIATIPPKDLRHATEKYPHKADIELHRITTRHQAAYEKFICRVNEKFVNCFNQEETGIHLALHTNLRIHRSKGRSSKFFYGRLYDGIHPQKSLKTEWIRKIEKAIKEFYSK